MTTGKYEWMSRAERNARIRHRLVRLGIQVRSPHLAPGRRSGERIASRYFYAVWVDAYCLALEHDERRPVTWLLHQPECEGVKLNQIQQCLAMADAIGLIENRVHGKAGGSMSGCHRPNWPSSPGGYNVR